MPKLTSQLQDYDTNSRPKAMEAARLKRENKTALQKLEASLKKGHNGFGFADVRYMLPVLCFCFLFVLFFSLILRLWQSCVSALRLLLLFVLWVVVSICAAGN